jgi:hypothetical protein
VEALPNRSTRADRPQPCRHYTSSLSRKKACDTFSVIFFSPARKSPADHCPPTPVIGVHADSSSRFDFAHFRVILRV